jgi:hypothetical protein
MDEQCIGYRHVTSSMVDVILSQVAATSSEKCDVKTKKCSYLVIFHIQKELLSRLCSIGQELKFSFESHSKEKLSDAFQSWLKQYMP